MMLKAAVLLLAGLFSVTEGAVFCYFQSWSVYRTTGSVASIDPKICTHVVYAFGKIDEITYEAKSADPYLDECTDWGARCSLKKLEALKKENPNLKTLLSIGGHSRGTMFSKMAYSAQSRSNFITSAIRWMEKYNFDGLDLDWSYPGHSVNGIADKENFVQLLREAYSSLHQQNKILSITVPGNLYNLERGFDIPGISPNVDFLQVKAYDLHGTWEPRTHHPAPLKAHPQDLDTAGYNVDSIITTYIEKGAPREKIVLGMSFAGKCWLLTGTETGFYAPGTSILEYTNPSYSKLCEEQKRDSWVIFTDPLMNEPYSLHGKLWCGFEDQNSVELKTKYARDMGLGGVMVYSLDQDDFKGNCHGEKFPLTRRAYETFMSYQPNVKFISNVKTTPIVNKIISNDVGLNNIQVNTIQTSPIPSERTYTLSEVQLLLQSILKNQGSNSLQNILKTSNSQNLNQIETMQQTQDLNKESLKQENLQNEIILHETMKSQVQQNAETFQNKMTSNNNMVPSNNLPPTIVTQNGDQSQNQNNQQQMRKRIRISQNSQQSQSPQNIIVTPQIPLKFPFQESIVSSNLQPQQQTNFNRVSQDVNVQSPVGVISHQNQNNIIRTSQDAVIKNQAELLQTQNQQNFIKGSQNIINQSPVNLLQTEQQANFNRITQNSVVQNPVRIIPTQQQNNIDIISQNSISRPVNLVQTEQQTNLNRVSQKDIVQKPVEILQSQQQGNLNSVAQNVIIQRPASFVQTQQQNTINRVPQNVINQRPQGGIQAQQQNNLNIGSQEQFIQGPVKTQQQTNFNRVSENTIIKRPAEINQNTKSSFDILGETESKEMALQTLFSLFDTKEILSILQSQPMEQQPMVQQSTGQQPKVSQIISHQPQPPWEIDTAPILSNFQNTDCIDPDLNADPNDCSVFLQCVSETGEAPFLTYRTPCPSGLLFSAEKKLCEHKHIVCEERAGQCSAHC